MQFFLAMTKLLIASGLGTDIEKNVEIINLNEENNCDDLPELRESATYGTGVNFINIKLAHFSYERLFSSYVLALNELSYKKFVCLMLMKLTAGQLWPSFFTLEVKLFTIIANLTSRQIWSLMIRCGHYKPSKLKHILT